MRAFSAKKYQKPIKINNSYVLVSRDGKVEMHVRENFKYILEDNSAVFYSLAKETEVAPRTVGC